MTKCPCCSTEIQTDKPIVDLDSNVVAWGNQQLKLSPQRAEIMHALVEKIPGFISLEQLTQHVWGHTELEDPRNSLKTQVFILRRELRALKGWRIATRHHGYQLERVV